LISRAEVANENLDDSSIPSRNQIQPSINNSSFGREESQNFITTNPAGSARPAVKAADGC